MKNNKSKETENKAKNHFISQLLHALNGVMWCGVYENVREYIYIWYGGKKEFIMIADCRIKNMYIRFFLSYCSLYVDDCIHHIFP